MFCVVLIEGVLFRARYLGSTQLISDGQPSKAVRMLQAQEAIGRIKVCVCMSCIYSVTQKSSSPKKLFAVLFTQVKYIYVTFCHYVASLHLHIFTSFDKFILIFNKMALIFLGVPIVFDVFSFRFHQVKSP